jgi:hypothetical protein
MGLALDADAGTIGGRDLLAAQSLVQPPAVVDRAEMLIRREAEAAGRRHQQAFERLRKLAPAHVEHDAALLRVQHLLRAVELRRARGFGDRLESDPAEDEDAVGPDGPIQDQLPRRPRFLVPSSYFDALVFGGVPEHEMRARLLSVLLRRIKYINDTYALTAAQEQKLLLAGKGDLKRLFDEVEDERGVFEQARRDEDRLRDFLRELAPLRARLGPDLFDSQSLFSKTLWKLHDEKQLVRRPPKSGR